MTTITITRATRRNHDKFQVFGNYEGRDDRYTFGVRSFDSPDAAERYAAAMLAAHAGSQLERTGE